MAIEADLRSETEKWLERIKEKRRTVADGRADYVKNLDAYISDSKHFLEKGDLIRAFEAVVWGWALLEVGLQEGILKEK